MLAYLYQYLVGGAVFAAGLWLVSRGGELGWRGRRGGRLALLLVGFVLLALLQGIFQWVSRR